MVTALGGDWRTDGNRTEAWGTRVPLTAERPARAQRRVGNRDFRRCLYAAVHYRNELCVAQLNSTARRIFIPGGHEHAIGIGGAVMRRERYPATLNFARPSYQNAVSM